MCWKLRMTTERPTQKNWSRERSGHVHNQLDFFSREGWKLPDSLRAQLKFDPFMASNRHEKCSYGTYEFKDEKQTKLVPDG